MISFLCSGHVDHGKSTLGGQILLKTGVVSEHKVAALEEEAIKYGMKGWGLSYVLDEDTDERKNGKTIYINTAEFEWKNKKYRFYDTPGHKIYIRQLIEGLSECNPEMTVGCLIVSSAIGEFESGLNGGQTKEDMLLLRACGIRSLIIVINKTDLTPVGSERYNKIKDELERVAANLRFPTVCCTGISALKGDGIDILLDLIADLHAKLPPPKDLGPPQTSDRWKARILIKKDNGCPFLITSGLALVAHVGGKEFSVVICKIEAKSGVRIIVAKNDDEVVMTLEGSMTGQKSQRLLLRKDTYTIGFGVLASPV